MNAFSVPPNYVASLQENLTDDVLRTPNADPLPLIADRTPELKTYAFEGGARPAVARDRHPGGAAIGSPP